MLRKVFLLLILIVLKVTVEAQMVRSFTPRFTTNETGEIRMIGNTLMTCPAGTDCTAAQSGFASPTGLLNNAFNMVYVEIDGSANSTFNSSEASLMMPAGASILWAGLYWGGDTGGAPVAPSAAQRGNVLFATPVSSYSSIMAVQVDNIGTRYQGYAEVTNLVAAAGNGTYRRANVQAGIGGDRYAGWSLIVAFKDNTMPARNLTIFDGFAAVTSTTPAVSINVGSFTTPPFGQVKTKVGMVSDEGDYAKTASCS